MIQITQQLISKDKYNLKCPYEMEKPQYIVVHNTANDASAKNEISYMQSNGDDTSFHYAVDDVNIIQGLPLTRNSWHCGDGANGKGNRYGISIEICYSKSGGAKYEVAEKNAIDLIRYLMDKYNIPINHVLPHQHFALDKKYCPHRILDKGWNMFISNIQNENKHICPTCKRPLDVDKYYQVCKGDTLSDIAKAYSLSLQQLLDANPEIKDPNKISVGQILKIKFN